MPGGTVPASGADRSAAEPEAARESAQPLSPVVAAAAPSREERNRRRSNPDTGAEGMAELRGFTGAADVRDSGRRNTEGEREGEREGRQGRATPREFTHGGAVRGTRGEPEAMRSGARQRVSNKECDSS
nr:hypothetical protein StreXyl84_42360 [Streptomyces sp. Xyl84]